MTEIPSFQPAPPDNGGPAFPHPDYLASGWHGMTLRDYFAAKAMYGMYAAPQQLCNNDGSAPEILTAEWIAKAAYETADAMLKARGGAA